MAILFRKSGGLAGGPPVGSSAPRAGAPPADPVGSAPPSPEQAAAAFPGPYLAAQLRAALWGCLVGVLIGLALSELWPAAG